MMWDLQQFLNYIRTAMPDNSQLTVVDLLKKSMALTMVFSACRIAELARMTVDTENVTSERIQVETNTKTALAAMQSIAILPVKDSGICPHAALMEWLRRRRTQTALVYQRPSNDEPLTATLVARMLRELMTRAGIPECYGPYSIKHAVITYLYTKEVKEVQINEFGRWSLSSHVPGAHYWIPTKDKDWLGYRIAEQ
jgi:site-specific recombinase XerD